MKNRPRTRQLARALVIALVLGFVTTVLVTSWCVAMAMTRLRTIRSDQWRIDGHDFVIMEFDGPAKAVFSWFPNPSGQVDLVFQPLTPASWSTIHDARLRGELNDEQRVLGTESSHPSRCDIAYGWPLLAFRGGYTAGLASATRTEDSGVPLPDIQSVDANVTTTEPRTLPFVPIFPGVAVNTAAYGGAWWLVLIGPGAVRRSRRRWGGACLACGYDRRGIAIGAVCPECGDTSRERERPGAVATVVPMA